MKTKYYVKKRKIKKQRIVYNSREINVLELIKDRKKTVNGIVISNIKVYHKEFIDYSINKKMQKRIKKLLELIATVFESDDDSGEQLLMILNEIERFRRMILNEYSLFISERQMFLLQKKLEMIENEIKSKMKDRTFMNHDYIQEVEKSSHHRR